MSAKANAGKFKNPLIRDTFSLITKESVLSVLNSSCDYFLKKENEYRDSREKAFKEINKYMTVTELGNLDKLYWEGILTLNKEVPKPIFSGESTYEAVKERLSNINYGG